jgi:plastocyanin
MRLIMRVEAFFPIHRLKSAAVLFCLIATPLLATAVAKSRAAKPAIVVIMMDMPPSFQPVQTSIKVGDTVEWTNIGTQLHHVTTDPAAALKKNDVSSPPGAKPFDSGFLKPGESFSATFSVPGTYRYTCAVHEAKGMNGVLIVQK